MSEELDPYEVLGVARNAGLEEVRQAYHKAALKCHPDNCPDDPEDAVRRFSQLTVAYRTVLRTVSGKSHTLSPQDFARSELGWSVVTPGEAYSPARPGWQAPPQKITYPTVDENRVFLWFWGVGIVVAMGVAFLIVRLVLSTRELPKDPDQKLTIWNFLSVAGPSLLVYGAVLGVTVMLLMMRRKIIWVVRHLGFRHLLPKPQRDTALPPSSAKLTEEKQS